TRPPRAAHALRARPRGAPRGSGAEPSRDARRAGPRPRELSTSLDPHPWPPLQVHPFSLRGCETMGRTAYLPSSSARTAASSSSTETEPSNFALIRPSRPTRKSHGSLGRRHSRTHWFPTFPTALSL